MVKKQKIFFLKKLKFGIFFSSKGCSLDSKLGNCVMTFLFLATPEPTDQPTHEPTAEPSHGNQKLKWRMYILVHHTMSILYFTGTEKKFLKANFQIF